MISNTTQELIQLQSSLSAAQASITSLGAALFITAETATAALDLANQKCWIQRSDISS
jgi:hypothetical protein